MQTFYLSAMLLERLEAQHLRERAPDVVSAARRLLALQGQDFPAVKWALGVRTVDATQSAVHAAFDSGALVRAWPMRGTLHVTAAEDLAWLSGLTAERMLAKAKTRQAQLELTARDVTKARDVAERVLHTPKTRAEFLELLERAKVSTAGQRGYHLIWTLAHLHVVCWGPLRGKEQALVLQAEWLPKTPKLERDEALARLAKRYFAGHGPATLEDLAWWCGLTKTEVKRGVEAAGGVPQVRTRRAPPREPALPLPAFDEYFLGYADRSPVIDAKFFQRVVPGGNGVFQPIIVERGRVVGTWKRAELTVLPFEGHAPRVDFAAFTRFVST